MVQLTYTFRARMHFNAPKY